MLPIGKSWWRAKPPGMGIYNKLKSVLKDEDLFVLAPVKVADMNGWLATSTVTWLSNQE